MCLPKHILLSYCLIYGVILFFVCVWACRRCQDGPVEPVTAAGDQVSGATVPLVQWQLPHGATAVPCPLDWEPGLVSNNWICGLSYESIFCFSSLVAYAIKSLFLLASTPSRLARGHSLWLADTLAHKQLLFFMSTFSLMTHFRDLMHIMYHTAPFQGQNRFPAKIFFFLKAKLKINNK